MKAVSVPTQKANAKQRNTDRAFRGTTNMVIDDRTRFLLFRLIETGKLGAIESLINSGKEACVFLARRGDPASQESGGAGETSEIRDSNPGQAEVPTAPYYAVKIYSTSILAFKARSQYIEGEHRFSHLSRSKRTNSRQLVRLWAEKEFRNLKRIYSLGTILVPRPILVRSTVLVTEFIGWEGRPRCAIRAESPESDGESTTSNGPKTVAASSATPGATLPPTSAPRLRDVAPHFSQGRLEKIYWSLLRAMHTLFHSAKLVHGDLSEFNILYMRKKAYIIDVGQSVDLTHPAALDFLRADIVNVNSFFSRCGIATLGNVDTLELVTTPLESDVRDGATGMVVGRRPEKRKPAGPGEAPSAVPGEVHDSFSPWGSEPVPADLVERIRTLRREKARLHTLQEITDDEAFKNCKIFDELRNLTLEDLDTGFWRDQSGLQSLMPGEQEEEPCEEMDDVSAERDTESQDSFDSAPVEAPCRPEVQSEPQIETEPSSEESPECGEGSHEKETSSPDSATRTSLDRADYSKEEWKRVQAEEREKRRLKRQEKVPKKEKKRAEVVSRRRRQGK